MRFFFASISTYLVDRLIRLVLRKHSFDTRAQTLDLFIAFLQVGLHAIYFASKEVVYKLSSKV